MVSEERRIWADYRDLLASMVEDVAKKAEDAGIQLTGEGLTRAREALAEAHSWDNWLEYQDEAQQLSRATVSVGRR